MVKEAKHLKIYCYTGHYRFRLALDLDLFKQGYISFQKIKPKVTGKATRRSSASRRAYALAA